MTQNTHSTVVDYQRRNKYYVLPPDFETSKKNINHGRAERWLRLATAGYGMNGHPTPGSLFSMGWSRSLSKDLFRFLKSDEKKNYLLMASILIYFLYHPSLIVSNTITFHPPCALRRSRVLSCTSPVAPACFWLVVGVFASFIGRLRPRRIFFSYFLSINSTVKPTPRPHPTRSTPAASLLHPPSHRFRRLQFDCCVTRLNGGHLRPMVRPSL